MTSVGETLKSKREKLGLSTKQIAEKIRIQEKYLIALEENDDQAFDSKVIARGFLIKYCDYLNIDWEKLLPFWRRDFNISTKRAETSSSFLSKINITPLVFSILVFALIIFSFVSFGFIQYAKFKKPPNIEIESPVEDQVYANPQVVVKGKTTEGSKIFMNNTELSLDSEGNFSENLNVSPGLNKLVFRSISPLGRETTKNITIYGDFSVEKKEEHNDSKKYTLKVKSISSTPVFVEVKSEDTVLFSGFLLENTEKTFSEDQLFFYTDKSELVELEVNGEKVKKEEDEFGVFVKEFN